MLLVSGDPRLLRQVILFRKLLLIFRKSPQKEERVMRDKRITVVTVFAALSTEAVFHGQKPPRMNLLFQYALCNHTQLFYYFIAIYCCIA